MNLYKVNPEQNFLSTLADFIINNFSQDLNQLKVILPTGFACLNLQRILLKKLGTSFLPNITPFFDLVTESTEIFKIPFEDIEAATYLEEKIILAEIILNYKKLSFNIIQALKFSAQLGQLFHELTLNSTTLKAIHSLSPIHQAEHWQTIYEFLSYAYAGWEEKMASLKKISQVHYKINMLAAESKRIAESRSNIIIVAGIFGHDKTTWQFLKNLTKTPQGILVLPPLPTNIDNSILQAVSSPEDALYCLKQLLATLGKRLEDFLPLSSATNNHLPLANRILLTGLLYSTPAIMSRENSPPAQTMLTNKGHPHIQYSEFNDIFTEAEAISLICQQYLHENRHIKIAIIVPNSKIKDFYVNFLNKYSLSFQDFHGSSLARLNISQLIIAISEVLCNIFDLKKLFILLKNPLLCSNMVMEFEQLLAEKNRFASSWEEVFSLIKATENEELIQWYENLSNLLITTDLDCHFNNQLKKVIKIAEALCTELWSNHNAFEVAEFFAALVKLNWSLPLKTEDFPEILKTLMSGANYFEPLKEAAIIVCKPQEALLLNFDLVILADFSDSSWPPKIAINPWFNRQMQEELELNSLLISSGQSLYYLYLLLHNRQVIITRSKKQDQDNQLLPSTYLFKIKLLMNLPELPFFFQEKEINYPSPPLGTVMVKHLSGIPSSNTSKARAKKKKYVTSDFFPARLSATDIEMLIRSPYSFYARKILGLVQQDSIVMAPKLSEFGNFIHKVIEKYTKTYDQTSSGKGKAIIDISEAFLANSRLPSTTKKIWQLKFSAIAEEFIEFDEERRKKAAHIYSELRGEMIINVAGQDIKIIAVADRIEIDNHGGATILDYKTGRIATKKDIDSGLSPQLIIEALMVLKGGFSIKASNIEKLVYVKIASSKPYIQTTEICITNDQLHKHFAGIENLLKYYVNNKTFSLEVDLLKYNNYTHLMRAQNDIQADHSP